MADANPIKQIIPVLKVESIQKALAFYTGVLGFSRQFLYSPDPDTPDPGYAGLTRDGLWLHLSSFGGDGVIGAVANFAVADVDAFFAEFRARGAPFDLEPCDQSWGTREMYLRDPDGNKLRFGTWLGAR